VKIGSRCDRRGLLTRRAPAQLVSFLALLACGTSAEASTTCALSPASLPGWWRADLSFNQQHTAVYLHVVQQGAAQGAMFSNPSVGAFDLPAGDIHVGSDTVDVPGLGLRFHIACGPRLETILPATLVPVHKILASFRRVDSGPSATQGASDGRSAAPIWTFQADGAVWAAPVHDPQANTILIATETGSVLALPATGGSPVWTFHAAASIRGTASVAGDSVLVNSDDGTVYALDRRTGRVRWQVKLGQPPARLPITDEKSRWDSYSASIVSVDDLFIAAGRDGCVHALESKFGTEHWHSCTKDLITSTPAVFGHSLLVASFDGHLYSMNIADGHINWQKDLHGAIPRDVVISDRNALIGTRSYDLIAVDPDSGTPRWQRYFWFSWVDSIPTVRDNVIYIGSSDASKVMALKQDSGHPIWERTLPGWVWAQPAVTKDVVYEGVVGGQYFLPRDGGLFALDRTSGAIRWAYRQEHAAADIEWGFAAAPVIVGDNVIAADLKGRVFAFRR
jgi:outer membrane protein assembly factor BamB